MQKRIDAAVIENSKYENEVHRASQQKEMLNELERKGKSATVEAKKLKKWNEKRDQKIEELKNQLETKKNEKKNLEKKIEEVERILFDIEEKNETKSNLYYFYL